MASTTMEISGMGEMLDALSRLEAWAQSDALKVGLKAGAEVVAEEAAKLVPTKSGRLKGAIRIRAGRKGPGSVSMLAAVGKRWFSGSEFYGAFVEFGRKTGKRANKAEETAGKTSTEVKIAKGRFAGRTRKIATGTGRKQIPGEHFMQIAFEEKKENAAGVMQTYFMGGIENELRKTGKTWIGGQGAVAFNGAK